MSEHKERFVAISDFAPGTLHDRLTGEEWLVYNVKAMAKSLNATIQPQPKQKPEPVIPQGRGDVKTIIGFDRASPDADFTGLTLLFSDGSIKHYHEAQPQVSMEAEKAKGWSHAINFCLQQAHLVELADEANGGPVKSHPKTEMWKDIAEMLTKAAALGGAPAEPKKNIPELYARREVGAGDGDTYVGEPHSKEYRLYYELIYAVENIWPGETRHQTALRYIRRAEQAAPPSTDKADLQPYAHMLREKLHNSTWPDSDPVWKTLESWAEYLCQLCALASPAAKEEKKP